MTEHTESVNPPFATVEDLSNRWHTLSESETAHAETLLDDASDIIIDLCDDWKEQRLETLKRITCQMVKRAMIAENTNPTGMTQYSQTAGSYSESGTYSNPNGDLYLTAVEKQALGIGKQQAFHITMGAPAC